MKTIAFFHNKGGAGKTTSCVNIAAALARLRHNVLLIDLDSQANATYGTGLIRFLDESQDDLAGHTVIEVLTKEGVSLAETAKKSRFNHPEIYVVPSHIRLAQSEQGLNRQQQSAHRLARKLSSEQVWDYVLIDAPPSLNIFAEMALLAADALVIPSDLKPFANLGLENVRALLSEVDATRVKMGRRPVKVLGVLPNKMPTNRQLLNGAVKQRVQRVQVSYGFTVFDNWIHERDAMARCLENMITFPDGESLPDPKSIFQFAPGSPAAEEVEKVTKEMLERLG